MLEVSHRRLQIRALVFDVDSTIFQVTPRVSYHYQLVLNAHNIFVDESSLNRALLSCWQEIRPYYENESHGYQTFPAREEALWHEYIRRVCKQVQVQPHTKLINDIYERFADGSTRSINADLLEVLAYCKNHQIIVGFFTNNDHRILPLARHFGIDTLCSFLLTAGDLGYKKPSPKPFIAMQTMLQCTPQECLYIGNSIEHDYLPPLQAGWHAYLFEPSIARADQYRTQGLKVICSLQELYSIVPV